MLAKNHAVFVLATAGEEAEEAVAEEADAEVQAEG